MAYLGKGREGVLGSWSSTYNEPVGEGEEEILLWEAE